MGGNEHTQGTTTPWEAATRTGEQVQRCGVVEGGDAGQRVRKTLEGGSHGLRAHKTLWGGDAM